MTFTGELLHQEALRLGLRIPHAFFFQMAVNAGAVVTLHAASLLQLFRSAAERPDPQWHMDIYGVHHAPLAVVRGTHLDAVACLELRQSNGRWLASAMANGDTLFEDRDCGAVTIEDAKSIVLDAVKSIL